MSGAADPTCDICGQGTFGAPRCGVCVRAIRRRMRAGYPEDGCVYALRDLLSSHSGDNLAHALAHNGFVPVANADAYARSYA
jgi:hypothetical protein